MVNIISYDASGDPVAIATGTDGQVLTSAGAGAPPAFEDASSPAGKQTIWVPAAAMQPTISNGCAIRNTVLHQLMRTVPDGDVLDFDKDADEKRSICHCIS